MEAGLLPAARTLHKAGWQSLMQIPKCKMESPQGGKGLPFRSHCG